MLAMNACLMLYQIFFYIATKPSLNSPEKLIYGEMVIVDLLQLITINIPEDRNY